MTHNLNTISWLANILSTDDYITHEQVAQSVSIVWVQYYLADRFIKYLFYSLTFGDIWIQFIAIFIYFEILMNYLHWRDEHQGTTGSNDLVKEYIVYQL